MFGYKKTHDFAIITTNNLQKDVVHEALSDILDEKSNVDFRCYEDGDTNVFEFSISAKSDVYDHFVWVIRENHYKLMQITKIERVYALIDLL